MQFSPKGNSYIFTESSQAYRPVKLSTNNLMKGKDKRMVNIFRLCLGLTIMNHLTQHLILDMLF